MKHSICIIDDKIPVKSFDTIKINETGLLGQDLLYHFLSDEYKWTDKNLYNLLVGFSSQSNIELFGFLNHSFYLNYIEESLFSPDVIIFDWDMAVEPQNPAESLKEIINDSFCLIAIYTEADKEGDVSRVLCMDEYKIHESRVFILKKENADSSNELLKAIKDRITHFSFKLGKSIKYNNLRAINSVLSSIGGLSFDHFIYLFGKRTGTGCEISAMDFIDIMNDQIRAKLIYFGADNQQHSSVTSVEDVLKIKKLWHFRMYHKPVDKIVRKGDIVWNIEEKKYYLITSSNCHMNGFWPKNLGYMTAVPLYEAGNSEILNRIGRYIKEKTFKSFSISSVVNPTALENITLLPAVDEDNDYILSPKEITSFNISLPENYDSINGSQMSLNYDNINFFDSSKRYRLNEVFLNPLIEFIFRNISDIGTPDYSFPIREHLADYIRNIKPFDKKQISARQSISTTEE